MRRAKWLVLCDIRAVGALDKHKEYIVPGYLMTVIPSEIRKQQITLLDESLLTHAEIKRQHSEVSGLYEIFLTKLSKKLNNHHGERFSCRGWEIILGPWLKLYLDTLYYRWKMLERILEQGIDGVFVCDVIEPQSRSIPLSRKQFVDDNVHSVRWNQFITSMMVTNLIKARGDKIIMGYHF